MKNQDDTRKNMLAKIHIAKKELGLDDDIYRDWLEAVTGLRSCSKMTMAQLEKVLKDAKRMGWQDNHQGVGRMPLHSAEHRPMFNKLAVLLKQVGKKWAYVDGMAKKMFDVERVNMLNADQLHKVVSALQIYVNRQTKGQ